jgi:hypothetical protein
MKAVHELEAQGDDQRQAKEGEDAQTVSPTPVMSLRRP